MRRSGSDFSVGDVFAERGGVERGGVPSAASRGVSGKWHAMRTAEWINDLKTVILNIKRQFTLLCNKKVFKKTIL